MSRADYILKGWNTSPNGTGTAYALGGSYGANASTTLYAQWLKKNELYVNPNGGNLEGNTSTYKYASLAQGESTLVTNPTRQYYKFAGWDTALSCIEGTNGYTVTMGATDETITAKWNPILYQVGYNANGGSGTINPQSKYTGNSVILSNGAGYTRTGYFMTGWNTSPTGTGTEYQLGGTYSANEDTTLYAQWLRKYNLYINPNGGNLGGNTSTFIYANLARGESTFVTNPTRIGYIFNGWETNLSNTAGTNGYTFTIESADATITAKWTPITYQIQYNGNENTGGDTQTSLHYYDIAKKLTANGYSKFAYSFAGWSTSTSGDVIYTDQKSVLNLTTTNQDVINLYAKWNLITHDIVGNLKWEDYNNKYNSRPESVNLKISHDGDTAISEPTPNPLTISSGDYTFNNAQTYKTVDGTPYIYNIEQTTQEPGYETTYNGTKITNTLILPEYSSNIKYEPVDNFEDLYLKNGKVKISAKVEANPDNRDLVGLNNGVATFNVDNKILIDNNSINIVYTNASTGKQTQITDYLINNNILTINFGENSNGISQKQDTLSIEIIGTITQIGDYNSQLDVTGKLKDYRGLNTNIDLGKVTSSSEDFIVENQMPEANIKLSKIDSITEQILTDAEFTLYEWDGSKYIEKEIIKDDDKDGKYESKYYRWNVITQGKYKIVETKIPENHKDSGFNMEYTLNQIRTQNYTVVPDYENSEYVISYSKAIPNDFDNILSVIENEPYKLDASIEKIDSENKKQISSDTKYTIYEWNKEENIYKEYVSYIFGNKVEMVRQSDGTYKTQEHLYYTLLNEGKYKIIETTAPYGYYADYINGSTTKNEYNINILDIVNSGKYNGQNISNEGTIKITNSDNLKLENQRVKGKIQVTLIDSQTKADAVLDSTLSGATYSLYAKEEIYHADGKTTNYIEKAGLLYKKDDLVMTKTTTKESKKLVFDNLECGKYYIKQITPSEGYLPDENVYEFDLSYINEETKLIEKQITTENIAKKQAFQILKVKESMEGLQNAGFSIYRISNLSIVTQGKITRIDKENYILNDENAKNSSFLKEKANSDGTYKISDLINYYYKISYEESNTESIPGNDTVYYPYNLTKETLAKDYSENKDGVIIEEIRTDNKGYMKSPELIYGEYIVIETSVPRKNDATKPFVVKVDKDSRIPQDYGFILDPNFRTKVKIYNKDAKTQKNILNNKAKYVIKDQQTGELKTIEVSNEKGNVEYGTYENPFVTNEEGYFITPMSLEIGKYTLEQVAAPTGYTKNGYEGYSENGQTIWDRNSKVNFEISSNTAYYTDNYLSSYIIVVEQENEEVLGTVKLKSQGEYLCSAEEDNEKYEFEHEIRGVGNSHYELRAAKNIYTKDDQGTKVYEENQKITTLITNNEGNAMIENIPLGEYYVVETLVGNGFFVNNQIEQFKINYVGDEVPVIFEETVRTEIRPTIEIELENKDTDTKEILYNSIFGLYTKEEIKYINTNGEEKTIPANKLICKNTTNDEGKIIFKQEENIDLPIGKYYIKQEQASIGYIKSEEIIDIDITAETITDEIKIKKEMLNKQNEIFIKKTDENGELLENSKLVLIEKESNEQILQWETVKQLQNVSKLKVGKEYLIKEVETAKGYATSEITEFKIKEDGSIETTAQLEVNTIILPSNVTKLEISIKDKIDDLCIENIKLQIINEQTNEIQKEITSTKEAINIEKLPIGKYILKEIEVPNEKGYVTNEDVKFEIKDTKDIQKVESIQNVSKVLIKIKDIETKKIMNDITLKIIKKSTNNIQKLEIKDTDEGYYIERLPIDKYIVKQETPKGYKEPKEKNLNLKDTIEVQTLEIEDIRLEFIIEVSQYLQKVTINGEETILDGNSIQKIEIVGSKVSTQEIILTYVVKVSNVGEVDGKIGKIITQIPLGCTFMETNNHDYWSAVNRREMINTTFKDKELKAGQSEEFIMNVNWDNGADNFGNKVNTVEIKDLSNIYNYKNKSVNNVKSEITTVFTIKTGEEVIATIKNITIIVIAELMVIAVIVSIELKFIKRDKLKIKNKYYNKL